MARLVFTQQLRRFTEVPELDLPAATLRAALDAAFDRNPRLRAYILDDQGHVRPHVVIFIDGRRLSDRTDLQQPVGANSSIHVLQALSGG
jgi:molybdopterin synthase sulfur carrier subunit